MHTARDWTLFGALALACLAACSAAAYPSLHGDAAIYFNFLRRFFELPFSYQPGRVSHGATSPLHVLVMAPVFHAAGEAWLTALRLVNFGLVSLGVVLLARSRPLAPPLLALLATLACLLSELLPATARGFETGVVCAGLGALLLCLRRRPWLAPLVAGLLLLARPEFLLVWPLVVYRAVRRAGWSRNLLPIAAGLLPAALFALYMGASGAGVLPSSALARLSRAGEGELGWLDQAAATTAILLRTDPMGLTALGALLLLGAWRRRASDELLVAGALALPYLLAPPGQFAPRYLLPAFLVAVSALVAQLGVVARAAPGPRRGIALLLLVAALAPLATWSHWKQRAEYARYDLDTWLLGDLARALTPLADPSDRVLLYEIQAQFHLTQRAISADGVVGTELRPFLDGRRRLEEIVRDAGIRWIVTSNAASYRPVFRDTFLAALFARDAELLPGQRVEVGGLLLEKALANPDFHVPGRYEERWLGPIGPLRVYGPARPHWRGHQILWNSVYRVIAPAASAGDAAGGAFQMKESTT